MRDHLKILACGASLLVGAAACSACGNACPADLIGVPSSESSGIQWGGDSAKVSADIRRVAVECLPAHHPAIETSALKRAAYTDYQISATATVQYTIKDRKYLDRLTQFGSLDADAVFEAVTGSGVVVGSATGSFRVVGGGSSGTMSATITGLSQEEIVRVRAVRVRWRYGR